MLNVETIVMNTKIKYHLKKNSKRLSRKRIYDFLAHEFSLIPPSEQVLSIGSGGKINELLYEYQQQQGFNVVTLDIDKKRIPDIQGDICTYDFQGSTYGVVVMGEVLEHLHSPHLAINNIYTILRSDGKLILTVPFLFPIHESPHDYFRYTRYGLEYLLKKFHKVVIKERNTWAEAINVLWVRHLMEQNFRSQLMAPVFISMAVILLPLMLLMGYMIKTNFMTTGYLVSATKTA